MDSPTDNTCPTWNSKTRAKELIVYLTGGIKAYDDAVKALTTTSQGLLQDPGSNPEEVASLNQKITVNQIHLQALTSCRDAIAAQLGTTASAVKQLYDYNTLTEDDVAMFHDLEMNNNDGQPDFSKLITMPDRRRALHMIDLEIRDLDGSIKDFGVMVEKDAGKPTEATDRKILANEEDFRGKLMTLRASIANKIKP